MAVGFDIKFLIFFCVKVKLSWIGFCLSYHSSAREFGTDMWTSERWFTIRYLNWFLEGKGSFDHSWVWWFEKVILVSRRKDIILGSFFFFFAVCS